MLCFVVKICCSCACRFGPLGSAPLFVFPVVCLFLDFNELLVPFQKKKKKKIIYPKALPYQNTNTKPSDNSSDCMIVSLAKTFFFGDIQTWFGSYVLASSALNPIGCEDMSRICYMFVSCWFWYIIKY